MELFFNKKKTVSGNDFLRGYLLEMFMKAKARLTDHEREEFMRLWKKIWRTDGVNEIIIP